MTLPASSLEQRRVRWQHACRVVPTRYPAVLLYDHVADAADFDALVALEAMSNERVRDEVAERLPLFGFYRALLRWLFLDPSSDAPHQEGVEVVLVD